MRPLIRRLAILLCMSCSALPAVSRDLTLKKSSGQMLNPVYHYERSPSVSPDVWEQVKPYLLPSNHPLKPRLDKLFSKIRVTASLKNVKEAGFSRAMRRNYSFTVVSPHPALRGYIVKMYLDEETGMQDYEKWITRIQGANAVRQFILEHGMQAMFKVPRKWIYPLPANPSPPEGSPGKNFILIAEDMRIYRHNDNAKRWKNSMTPDRLAAYYLIVDTLGLKDNVMAFNCPFCMDGRQAFIDTEWHHEWPIHWEKLLPFLSKPMQTFFTDSINPATKKH